MNLLGTSLSQVNVSSLFKKSIVSLTSCLAITSGILLVANHPAKAAVFQLEFKEGLEGHGTMTIEDALIPEASENVILGSNLYGATFAWSFTINNAEKDIFDPNNVLSEETYSTELVNVTLDSDGYFLPLNGFFTDGFKEELDEAFKAASFSFEDGELVGIDNYNLSFAGGGTQRAELSLTLNQNSGELKYSSLEMPGDQIEKTIDIEMSDMEPTFSTLVPAEKPNNDTPQAVPEPNTFVGLMLLGLGSLWHKRKSLMR